MKKFKLAGLCLTLLWAGALPTGLLAQGAPEAQGPVVAASEAAAAATAAGETPPATPALDGAVLFTTLTEKKSTDGMTEEQITAAVESFQGSPEYTGFTANNLWILIAGMLVFIMHLGFSTVESGLTRAKNTTNVLFKNVWIVCIGVLTYAFVGFNVMYPGSDFEGGYLPLAKFMAWGIPGSDALGDPLSATNIYNASYPVWTDFFFQAMFAATGATIVSGAVAERVKLSSFLIYVTLFVMIAYPISGYWKWGMGWLNANGFYDFAGSSVVHGFGGFGALAAVLLLGPRKGKYLPDGKMKPIPGHSFPLATIGVFMLFLGWFGFNGGSVLSANPALISYVCVTTTLAGTAGGISASLVSWIFLKKPDLSMALNGILAGLVGITAGADTVGMLSAVIIGIVAGVLVFFSVLLLDKIKIDDPVGAVSVHGTCGVWGTLAVAIFGFEAEGKGYSLMWQAIGTVSICAWSFVFTLVVFGILKAVMGIRVSADEEEEGLDLGEHGQEAYPDFQPASR